MKIERVEADLTGAKRQRIPVTIEWECPECHQTNTLDLTERYLSYPEWGEPLDVGVFCMDCDEVEPITELTIVPDITIESVK